MSSQVRNPLLTLLFLFMVSTVTARSRADTTYDYAPVRSPKVTVFRATIKLVSGKKFTGILYDLTDTTLVYFADNQAAVRNFKAGTLPNLKAIRLDDLKKVAIWRRGHFWIANGITVGLATGLWMLISTMGTPDIGTAILKLIALYIIIPVAILTGVVVGTLSKTTVRTMGNSYYVKSAWRVLYKYTVVAQQQPKRYYQK